MTFPSYSNRMGYQSGGYPTGRSPMAFDLATPTYALAQQMIKRKESQLAQQKGMIDQSVNSMLKALDFETIKGLGRLTQEKHLENLENLDQKWTERLAERDGIFSAKDLQELKFDKEEVENNLARMQKDVEDYAFVQKQLIEDLGRPQEEQIWDLPASMDKFMQYANNVGQGSAMEALIKRKERPDEAVQRLYGNVLDDRAEKFLSRNIDRISNGIIYYTDGNTELLKDLKSRFKRGLNADTRLLPVIENYGTEEVDKAFDRAIDIRIGDKKGFTQRSGYGSSTRQDADANISLANEILEGLKNKNKHAVAQIKKGSNVKDLIYDEKKDAYLITDMQGRSIEIPFPPENATERDWMKWKLNFEKYLPFASTELPKDLNYIKGDYSQQMPEEYAFEPIADRSLADMEAELNLPQEEVSALDNEGDKKRTERVLKAAETLLPDNFKVEKGPWKKPLGGYSSKKTSDIRIKITDDQGKEMIFQLDKADDSKKLWDFIKKNNKYGSGTEKSNSNVPEFDKQYLLDQGYSEEQIMNGVKNGTIKLK